jgi:hypothetical protein
MLDQSRDNPLVALMVFGAMAAVLYFGLKFVESPSPRRGFALAGATLTLWGYFE